VDQTGSADRLPPSVAPNDIPAKMTRNTGAVATDLAPGESREYPEVPGYEILGILGHGGMGVVYRARQLGANRLVALKMIRAFEHASPTERLRFQIETEAVARLQHPHIVQLYEVGEVRSQPFFSLEFCDGGTFTDQLKKQRPTPHEAAALIETLARAMHYAHLRGVVHRDLKPGNVLLTGAERLPKITDFGLAKRIDAEAREVSQSGAIMGTASYMAPEQAAGKVRDTGPAADVYALGALLYECLTGRPPFEGPQHVVLASVLSDEPASPSSLVLKVPRDLETICLKCLSKEPARRYASAEELANDLQRFQAGEPIRARPVGALERAAKWARRNLVLTGMTAVAALALVAGTGISIIFAIDARQKEADAIDNAKKLAIANEKLAETAKDLKGSRDNLEKTLQLYAMTVARTRRRIIVDLLRRGKYEEAIADADAIASLPQIPGEALYDSACVFGVVARAGTNPAAREKNAARCVELLRRAFSAGFGKDPIQKASGIFGDPIKHMEADGDLDVVRGREDYKKLLEDLRRKP
jgi:hypothetical protein